MNTYYMSVAPLGTGDTLMNKKSRSLSPGSLHSNTIADRIAINNYITWGVETYMLSKIWHV